MNIMNCRLSATFQNPNYSWTQLLAIHNKVEEKKKNTKVCLSTSLYNQNAYKAMKCKLQFFS